MVDGFMQSIPMGCPGQPEEVVVAVAFAGDDASFVTGVALRVARRLPRLSPAHRTLTPQDDAAMPVNEP